MGRLPGRVLVLLAITLALANAGCFARCVVQSCQDSKPPCHSHGSTEPQHCPQQNQMKMAATGALALDLGAGFIPVEWPVEVTQTEQPYRPIAVSLTPPTTVLPPLALRI